MCRSGLTVMQIRSCQLAVSLSGGGGGYLLSTVRVGRVDMGPIFSLHGG